MRVVCELKELGVWSIASLTISLMRESGMVDSLLNWYIVRRALTASKKALQLGAMVLIALAKVREEGWWTWEDILEVGRILLAVVGRKRRASVAAICGNIGNCRLSSTTTRAIDTPKVVRIGVYLQ